MYVLRKLVSPAQILDTQTIPVEVSDFYLCCVSLPACGRLSKSKCSEELREAPPRLPADSAVEADIATVADAKTEEVPDGHKTFLTYPTSKQDPKTI